MASACVACARSCDVCFTFSTTIVWGALGVALIAISALGFTGHLPLSSGVSGGFAAAGGLLFSYFIVKCILSIKACKDSMV